MVIITCCVVLLAIIGLVLVYISHNLHQENVKLKQDVAAHNQMYLRKQGCTSLWKGSAGKMLTYELRSFDGGKKWYAVKSDDNGGLVVIGEAYAVYPGLLDHLQGMDALFDAVAKEGPLNLGEPSSVKLLKNAGFDVVSPTNK